MQTQMNKLNIKFLLLVSIFFNVYQLQADEEKYGPQSNYPGGYRGQSTKKSPRPKQG